MKHLYGVETKEELDKYQKFVERIQPRLDEYLKFLQTEYAVRDLPRTILWTGKEAATSLISDIPVPAYTNEYRVVMTPDIEAWRSLYLKQLEGIENQKENEAARQSIKEYYLKELSENHIMQILGHELAHHSEWFLEDFDSALSDGIWFEEGMVEYISRRYFLTEEEFEQEAFYNQQLVNLLKEKYGTHSLEKFGQATYEGDYASIFFEYWRSFLAVKKVIEDYNGNIRKVFHSYHEWHEKNNGQTLVEWFQVCI